MNVMRNHFSIAEGTSGRVHDLQALEAWTHGSLRMRLLASRGLFPPGGPSCVGAFSWVSGRVAGGLLLPLRDLGKGNDLHRSLPMKAFPVALRNELRQGELPGLLPVVGEPTKFLVVYLYAADNSIGPNIG